VAMRFKGVTRSILPPVNCPISAPAMQALVTWEPWIWAVVMWEPVTLVVATVVSKISNPLPTTRHHNLTQRIPRILAHIAILHQPHIPLKIPHRRIGKLTKMPTDRAVIITR
jgi:hypothetical protein